jgi:hypothetical protein
MRKYFLLMVVSSLAIGCSRIPDEAYSNRGTPESLLDVSSEAVAVELSSEESIGEIKDWVESDQPTRAIIYCANGDVICSSVGDVLDLYGVEYETMPADYSEVSLVYERVISRDCNNSYVDNRINPYNMHNPSFGCSIASNMVQMVTNRNEFVNPDLLGNLDGRSAAKTMRSYRFFDFKKAYSASNSNALNVNSINFQGSN